MSDDNFEDGEFEEEYDEKVNPSEVGKGARVILPPAYYLFLVSDVIRKSRHDDSQYFLLELQVAQSSKGDAMNNEVHREFLNLGSDERERLRRLAFQLATELTTKEIIEACKKEGRKLSIDYKAAIGQYLVAELATRQVKQRDENGNDVIRNAKAVWIDDPKGETQVPFDRFYHPPQPLLAKRGFKIDKFKMQTADAFGGSEKPSAKTASPADDFG